MNQLGIISLVLSLCLVLTTQEALCIATFTKNHLIPGAAIYASTPGGDEANRLAKDGVFIGTDSKSNYIDLANGNILLNPEKDITVGTHAGNIYVGAEATVFIIECGNDVVLYDLFQTKPKQVAVIVGIHKLVMHPGRMLVITRQNTDDFEKIALNCHSIAYSNAQPLNLHSQKDAITAFVANFSIPSALITIQPLKQLIASNNQQDKITLERLVRSSIILGNSDAGVPPQSIKFANSTHSQ